MRGRQLPPVPRPRLTVRRRPPRAEGPEPERVESPLPEEAPASLRDAIRAGEEALEAANVGESIADARLLVAHALGASPTWVFTHETEAIPEQAWGAYRGLIARRCRREPLQHIRGEQEFFGLRIAVTPAVLIPRPETELVVERVIAALHGRHGARIADVGTGSGAIATAVAHEIPGCRVVATDESADALEVARRNARELGVEERITFALGWLTEPLRDHAPFDAIAANLPYVTTPEWESLEPEVRDYEPRLALDGGADGLDLIRALVTEAPAMLAPGGSLVLEVGHEHGAVVAELLAVHGFTEVAIRRDLAGIQRVVEGRRGGESRGSVDGR